MNLKFSIVRVFAASGILFASDSLASPAPATNAAQCSGVGGLCGGFTGTGTLFFCCAGLICNGALGGPGVRYLCQTHISNQLTLILLGGMRVAQGARHSCRRPMLQWFVLEELWYAFVLVQKEVHINRDMFSSAIKCSEIFVVCSGSRISRL
jgi:hypothetical protein